MYKFKKNRILKNAQPYFRITYKKQNGSSETVVLYSSSLDSLNELLSKIEVTQKNLDKELLKTKTKRNGNSNHYEIYSILNRDTNKAINTEVNFEYTREIQTDSIEIKLTEEELLELKEKEIIQLKLEMKRRKENLFRSFQNSLGFQENIISEFYENEECDGQEYIVDSYILDMEFSLEMEIFKRKKKNSNDEDLIDYFDKYLNNIKKEEKKELNRIKKNKPKKTTRTEYIEKEKIIYNKMELLKIDYFDEEELHYEIEFSSLSEMIANF